MRAAASAFAVLVVACSSNPSPQPQPVDVEAEAHVLLAFQCLDATATPSGSHLLSMNLASGAIERRLDLEPISPPTISSQDDAPYLVYPDGRVNELDPSAPWMIRRSWIVESDGAPGSLVKAGGKAFVGFGSRTQLAVVDTRGADPPHTIDLSSWYQPGEAETPSFGQLTYVPERHVVYVALGSWKPAIGCTPPSPHETPTNCISSTGRTRIVAVDPDSEAIVGTILVPDFAISEIVYDTVRDRLVMRAIEPSSAMLVAASDGNVTKLDAVPLSPFVFLADGRAIGDDSTGVTTFWDGIGKIPGPRLFSAPRPWVYAGTSLVGIRTEHPVAEASPMIIRHPIATYALATGDVSTLASDPYGCAIADVPKLAVWPPAKK